MQNLDIIAIFSVFTAVSSKLNKYGSAPSDPVDTFLYWLGLDGPVDQEINWSPRVSLSVASFPAHFLHPERPIDESSL